MKSENLKFLEPSGPLQTCNGTDLPYYRPTNLDRTPLTSVTAHAIRSADYANTVDTCAGLVLTVVMLGSKVRTKCIP